MPETGQHSFYEILEECYDLQLELADAHESYEILISDIELVIDEISEHLQRIRSHMEEVEKAFFDYTINHRQNPMPEKQQELSFD